jgi:hypothetical protein
MYPDDKRAKHVVSDTSSAASAQLMSKSDCIDMIGEEKFDHYTQMFGSEAEAIKRCTMIRAIQNR